MEIYCYGRMQTMLHCGTIYLKIRIIFSDLCWLFVQKFNWTFVQCVSYFGHILVKICIARQLLVYFPSSIFQRSAFRDSLGDMYLQLRAQFQVRANCNTKLYRCAYLKFDILFHLLRRNHLLRIDTRHKAIYIDCTSVILEKHWPLVT